MAVTFILCQGELTVQASIAPDPKPTCPLPSVGGRWGKELGLPQRLKPGPPAPWTAPPQVHEGSLFCQPQEHRCPGRNQPGHFGLLPGWGRSPSAAQRASLGVSRFPSSFLKHKLTAEWLSLARKSGHRRLGAEEAREQSSPGRNNESAKHMEEPLTLGGSGG
jgi:hypothetical protein